MRSHSQWLVLIILLTVFCIWVTLPAETKGVQPNHPECNRVQSEGVVDEDGKLIDTGEIVCTEYLIIDINSDHSPEFILPIQQSLGLDLVGGLRVLLRADLPIDQFTTEDLAETANSVSRRVNALGLTEATVQVQGRDRVLVELPGITDSERAISTIQQTALLEFVDFGGLGQLLNNYVGQKILTTEQVRLNSSREQDDEAVAPLVHPVTGQPFETVITGAALGGASAQFAPTHQGGQPDWFIAFEINSEYTDTFGSFTESRINEPMAILLDGEVISAPVINSRLDTGGIISGQFTQEEATTLALQLRSGALPIPLRIESAQEVGATLGQESVRLSIQAGFIGIIVVLAFMLIYYRLPGLTADLALLVFISLNLAVFKLLPVTLTLPAITGFLISVGTAVDGNILIFERIKEELRAGLSLEEALPAGFDRAWTSIRDSNLSTIIICVILFFFGQTPGASIVSGFAVTLGIGLILNLFTAIIVTRTFLFIIVGFTRNIIANRKWLMGV